MTQSPADNDPRKVRNDDEAGRRLEVLSARLEKLQRDRNVPSADAGRGAALGMAFRLGTEFVLGVGIGGGMGWLLDRWLGTSPWLFILFLFLGMGAGVLNVARTAKQMNAATYTDAPAVPFDDDED